MEIYTLFLVNKLLERKKEEKFETNESSVISAVKSSDTNIFHSSSFLSVGLSLCLSLPFSFSALMKLLVNKS